MPSYLDFDTTKKFRDVILGKTLSDPNGSQTFNSSNYIEQRLSDFPNVNLGDVTTGRGSELTQSQNANTYKPEQYLIKEDLEILQRQYNLTLYPDFVEGQSYNLVGIMNTSNYDTESQLFKLSAANIKSNSLGPVLSRVQQNISASPIGKNPILNSVAGSSASPISIITGKRPLIPYSNKITIDNTVGDIPIDFLGSIDGTASPFVTIPGDYLTNPSNPINNNNTSSISSLLNNVNQDLTGVLGSMIGITTQRTPNVSKSPSDLFIDYMGDGTKMELYSNLSFSKYAPNYTTNARSQNSSKVFTSSDSYAKNTSASSGIEAPAGVAYIGDDRGEDVKYAMGDFNDRIVRSNYYLSLMFDPIQAELFEVQRNITESGSIGGNLTWISRGSKNKTGINTNTIQNPPTFDRVTRTELPTSDPLYAYGLSTKYTFRDDSILGQTQQILDTMPTNAGSARSHVANVIDQTSRFFREGDSVYSRGSNIKYVNKFTGRETGIEFCRVWTKDRPNMNNSNLMKRTGLLRYIKGAEGSIYTSAYNLNIYPNSNGVNSFDGSSNILKSDANSGGSTGDGFYAKKYMFSIENLAWKTSNTPGFTYNDLPYCERGNNGGRVMWFPPYDLKVTEQNNARWQENMFIGRPEPIYTYQNTSRSGQLSFKVVVDHPSILNLLAQKHFKGMSDEQADNYINAFFAGCEDLDFYGLIRKYTTLTTTDAQQIQSYLNGGVNPTTIEQFKSSLDPVATTNPYESPNNNGGNGNADGNPLGTLTTSLYFPNDSPAGNGDLYAAKNYTDIYNGYIDNQSSFIELLTDGLTSLVTSTDSTLKTNDLTVLYGQVPTDLNVATGQTITIINDGFTTLTSNFTNYNTYINNLKLLISTGQITEIDVDISSTASFPKDNLYNLELSFRRSHSIIMDLLTKLSSNESAPDFTWPSSNYLDGNTVTFTGQIKFNLTDLGYDASEVGSAQIIFYSIKNEGEQATIQIPNGKNIDCTKNNIYTQSLRITSPPTFFCRESSIKIAYVTKPSSPTLTTGTNTSVSTLPNIPSSSTNTLIPKVNLIPIPQSKQPTVPPLDEMKKIVMKTLSECYYFKKLEDDTPTVFKSLKEKLKYFHPAFHSTTPEGLNARLTFLNQCVRPGDTIPIKGLTDNNDLNARNTSFGPPPICVLRIGDFYHSKIIIRDVNISFDEGLWDLNPEGIGVQPMIANVQLTISFIGGHGLEKPVEMLQNALSSNFYANTEIYDYRSVSTELNNDVSTFTKEFLQSIQTNVPKTNLTQTNLNSAGSTANGTYIGSSLLGSLTYDSLISSVFTNMSSYFDSYKNAITSISTKYGSQISGLFFSQDYRSVFNYIVNTNGGTQSIELLGQYTPQQELSVLANNFSTNMSNYLSTTNITTILGLNDVFNGDTKALNRSELIIKPVVKTQMLSIIDGFSSDVAMISGLESTRNTLISNLDKLNFILDTGGYDGQISGSTPVLIGLTSFDSGSFYSNYSTCIDYITANGTADPGSGKNFDVFDETYKFIGGTLNDSTFKELLLVLLKDQMNILSNIYQNDGGFIKYQSSIDSTLKSILVPQIPITVSVPSYPTQSSSNSITYSVGSVSSILTFDQQTKLTNIFSSKVSLGTTLNYYKP